MKQTLPLRQNYEFARVYQKGRFLSSRHVVLHVLRRKGNQLRLGVTASRQINGSIRRNRIKRLLRESYRLMEGQIKPGYDLILVGRKTKTPPDLHGVMPDVIHLLRRAGLFSETDRCVPDTASGRQSSGNRE